MFHVGYFHSIINILQTICKSCARVLLSESEKDSFRIRLSNENLSYMTKKTIRKRIVEKCKKITRCPHCKEVNGFVKKLTAGKGNPGGSVLKIIHERKNQDLEELQKASYAKFSSAIEANPDIKAALASSHISQIITPVDALKLFERIPQSDIPLLGMDSRRYSLL